MAMFLSGTKRKQQSTLKKKGIRVLSKKLLTELPRITRSQTFIPAPKMSKQKNSNSSSSQNPNSSKSFTHSAVVGTAGQTKSELESSLQTMSPGRPKKKQRGSLDRIAQKSSWNVLSNHDVQHAFSGGTTHVHDVFDTLVYGKPPGTTTKCRVPKSAQTKPVDWEERVAITSQHGATFLSAFHAAQKAKGAHVK